MWAPSASSLVAGRAPLLQRQPDTAADPQREQVLTALRTRDVGDVKAIKNVNRASEDEKLELIRILLDQGWVGARDEWKLEEIWGSLGDRLGPVMAANQLLWNQCIDRGADLQNLVEVRPLRDQFKHDVLQLASNYSSTNREYVLNEMKSLGITADAGQAAQPLTQDQTTKLQELQNASRIVAQLQQGREDLRRVQVGRKDDPMAMPPAGGPVDPALLYHSPATFDPLFPPKYPPGPGDDHMQHWEKVKAADDQARDIIAVITDRYPAIYAISREGQSATSAAFGNQTSPEQARAQLGDALRRLVQDIGATQAKLNDADSDLAFDLVPIQQQLLNGQTTVSATNWHDALPTWTAQYELKRHEAKEYWIRLGLQTAAAAAFLIAPFTGGASLVVMLAGLGAQAGLAAMSADKFNTLSSIAKTAVRSDSQLVTDEQVGFAKIQADADQAALIIAAITVAVGAVAAGVGAITRALGRAPSLRVCMGESVYAEYEAAINALKAEHPQLASIPTDDLIAIRGYSANDYAKLNAALRSGDPEQIAQLQTYIQSAQRGLQGLPSYQGQVTRTVSMTEDMVAKYEPGQVVTEESFTSSSAPGGSAPQREGNIAMQIQSATGKDVSLISRVPTEKEVLFLPGTQFRVVSVQRFGDAWVIRMVEVGGS